MTPFQTRDYLLGLADIFRFSDIEADKLAKLIDGGFIVESSGNCPSASEFLALLQRYDELYVFGLARRDGSDDPASSVVIKGVGVKEGSFFPQQSVMGLARFAVAHKASELRVKGNELQAWWD